MEGIRAVINLSTMGVDAQEWLQFLRVRIFADYTDPEDDIEDQIATVNMG